MAEDMGVTPSVRAALRIRAEDLADFLAKLLTEAEATLASEPEWTAAWSEARAEVALVERISTAIGEMLELRA